MNVQIRARDKDSVAEFLGWFSIGLGAAQLAAPRALSRLVGADDRGTTPKVMRLFGLREITQGAGILTRPRPTGWLWSRVAGDALDLSLLALTLAKRRRTRTLLAIANVAAVAIPDVKQARELSRKQGPVRAAKRIRKAVTIRQARLPAFGRRRTRASTPRWPCWRRATMAPRKVSQTKSQRETSSETVMPELKA